MALTLPKPSLPKSALNNKQILAIVGGIIVLCAAGWFGWQYFEDAGPPPAPPKKPQPVTVAKTPAAAKAAAPVDAGAARDKLIEDLLGASGLKQQLNQLPQKMITGIRQAGKAQSKATSALLKRIEGAVAETFSAQGFHERVSADLKKNFDDKRMQALLKDFSAPPAKRMIEMQQAPASQEELTQFARSAAAARPSAARANLIKRIDAATRASDLAIEIESASIKGLALGSAGADAQKSRAVEKTIERQRASAGANIRNATLLNLAFSYRNASDDDLKQYAEFYETENSQWLTGIVYTALLEEARSASAQAGDRIGAVAPKPAPLARASGGPMSRADARACLKLPTNSAIMKCAEPYR